MMDVPSSHTSQEKGTHGKQVFWLIRIKLPALPSRAAAQWRFRMRARIHSGGTAREVRPLPFSPSGEGTCRKGGLYAR